MCESSVNSESAQSSQPLKTGRVQRRKNGLEKLLIVALDASF